MTTPMQRSSRLIKAIPFFYGWVILLVGTWGSVMMGPSQTFTFGLFIVITLLMACTVWFTKRPQKQ